MKFKELKALLVGSVLLQASLGHIADGHSAVRHRETAKLPGREYNWRLTNVVVVRYDMLRQQHRFEEMRTLEAVYEALKVPQNATPYQVIQTLRSRISHLRQFVRRQNQAILQWQQQQQQQWDIHRKWNIDSMRKAQQCTKAFVAFYVQAENQLLAGRKNLSFDLPPVLYRPTTTVTVTPLPEQAAPQPYDQGEANRAADEYAARNRAEVESNERKLQQYRREDALDSYHNPYQSH